MFKNRAVYFGYLLLFSLCLACRAGNSSKKQLVAPAVTPVAAQPGVRPDRILLTWQTNPATSQAVTWRTDATVKTPQAEIAEADASPLFTYYSTRFPAKTEWLKIGAGTALYHSINFTNLKPGKLYAYRVGDGTYWSEWFQFRTASDKVEPFAFIFLGDAQNDLFSLWSRTIRAAYAAAPQARFMLHAGDMINKAESDADWQEWFAAGSFIYATIPNLFTPGNHEYARTAGLPHISKLWHPQVNMPQNGPPGKEDLVYFIDYQNIRIISLNSYWGIAGQANWLEKTLKNNPQKWTVVIYHYPIFSAHRDRVNESMIRHWQPLFDKYKVDLVLQGHDHTYARGIGISAGDAKAALAGPVYVVSISGPKMYNLAEAKWANRSAENTQLFQVISINNDKLLYKSIAVTGELYDAFELTKLQNGLKNVTEIKPEITEERRFNNTLSPPKK